MEVQPALGFGACAATTVAGCKTVFLRAGDTGTAVLSCLRISTGTKLANIYLWCFLNLENTIGGVE